jgi:phage-related tail fiber protein
MKRQWLANAAVGAPAAPGAPSVGYPQEGASPTIPGAYWYHMMTEELRAVVIAGGLAEDAAVLTQVRDAIAAMIAAATTASPFPAGSVVFVGQGSAPTGFLKANGAVVSQTTYAALFAAYGTAFNTGGEGAGNFRLPDLRGEFVRGWDDSRGIDTSRVLGSLQLDALQGHWHELRADGTGAGSGGGYMGLQSGGSSLMAQAVKALVSDGTNGTPRIAAESRPRNVAFLACVKY